MTFLCLILVFISSLLPLLIHSSIPEPPLPTHYFGPSIRVKVANWTSLINYPHSLLPRTENEVNELTDWLLSLKQTGDLFDVILSGSIPRSGSTLFFNLLRFLAQKKTSIPPISSYAKWQVLRGAKESPVIMKLHSAQPYWADVADLTFFNFRDPRAATASFITKWPVSRKTLAGWRKKQCAGVQNWFIRGGYAIRYELLQEYLPDLLPLLGKILQIDLNSEDVQEILKDLEGLEEANLEKSINVTTQYHPHHRTNQGDQWDTVLTLDEIKVVNQLCHSFMVEFGYDPTCTNASECQHPYLQSIQQKVDLSSLKEKNVTQTEGPFKLNHLTEEQKNAIMDELIIFRLRSTKYPLSDHLKSV